ncbi:4Fe-4S binding protein [Mailhella massiliensis]|uniref:4Fe-4S binding protein n=1 Tax=Mailhella massiliensis TaxID=1903261 RepID=UPI002352BC53|nr:4Fe-4S binding protein [Mailhella massiliensis]
MTIEEIYRRFDRIGSCVFATVNGDTPETRVAHFLACDEEGLYFMTMTTKPFYRQLKEGGRVSVCALSASPEIRQTEEGLLEMEPGYFIRVTGDVREVSMEEIRAKNNPAFAYCIEDQQRYPAMTAFVLYRAWGEIFDYDFDMKKRDHKLERERFCFGGHRVEEPGLVITESCTGCGRCMKVCTFKAVRREGNRFVIDGSRCDECGDCWVHCPAGAVRHKGLPGNAPHGGRHEA